MLAICEYLHERIEDISILILTGSPMLHSFRVTNGIDYIKLPCLKRSEAGDLGVRFLDLESDEVIGLRKQLILSSVRSFRPDVVFVDKKPAGLAGELEPALRYLKACMPATKVMLVLRDILDAPAPTREQWRKSGSDELVEWFYDSVLVLGSAPIFDMREEYGFSPGVQDKIIHCGYVKRQPGRGSRVSIRVELGVVAGEKLILVTAGGGEDGCALMQAYVAGLKLMPTEANVRTVIVTGPEMARSRCLQLKRELAGRSDVRVLEFTDDLMSYMDAADLVISMAGYNTVCELLTLRKPAILVPRVEPVAEQRIRAERMSTFGLFETLLPSELSARAFADAIGRQLRRTRATAVREFVDMEALPRIGKLMDGMWRPRVEAAIAAGQLSVGV